MGRARAGLRVAAWSLATLALLSVFFHRDVRPLLFGGATRPAEVSPGAPLPVSESEAELTQFAAYVAGHVQASYDRELAERGRSYSEAKLVHFTDRVRAPCGLSEVVTGAFYCAEEERAYVDLGLYRELRRRYGRPGDFAEAYVIAHAMGHHLQNVQGTTAWVRRQEARRPSRKEDLTERAELQADCYAGVWARLATEQELLHPGDLESGMEVASRAPRELAPRSPGAIELETYDHGTSARRAAWFKRGFENGRLEACDTFARDAL